MHIIDAEQVETTLSWPETVEIIRQTMIDVSKGAIKAPLRTIMAIDDNNRMGMMPGAIDNPPVHGIKLISLYPDNPSKGLSSHQGMMVIFDSRTGTPIASLEAGALTALRTPAATVVATRELARKSSKIHTILSAGEQAHKHLEAFLACSEIKEFRIWARRPEAASEMLDKMNAPDSVKVIEDIEQAVKGADIITSVSASPEPILMGKWLEPGQHVNLVGSSVPQFREIDTEGVLKLSYFIDYRPSTEAQAGEYIDELKAGNITEEYILGEIGEVLGGNIPGRTSDDQITAYKSLGVAPQDLTVSWEILKKLGLTD